jgi:hypothetical protein
MFQGRKEFTSHFTKVVGAQTLAEAWQRCEDGHELVKLCGLLIDTEGWPTKQEILLAVCDCAETVLPYLPKEETRSRECVRVSRLWAEGKATVEEIKEEGRIAAGVLSVRDFRLPSPPEGQSAIGRLPSGVPWYQAAVAAYSVAYAGFLAADADAHAASGDADAASGSSYSFMCVTNAVPSFAVRALAYAAGAPEGSAVWRNAQSESLKNMADLVRARLHPTAWEI